MTGQYQQGQGFTQSPRLAMAQALMARGSSTDPVRSPLEGIARALTGAAGGFFAGQARADQQKALSDALAALNDPAIPADQRMNKAIEAAGDSPFADQLRGIAVSKMLPKEPASPLGKMWADAQQLLADHPVRKMFETAIAKEAGDPTYLRQSEAAKGQGGFDAKIAGEPALINATSAPNANAAAAKAQAENPALIARTGGQAQATANVDLAMKPRIGAATIAAETPGMVSRAGQTSEATTAGTNRANLATVQTPNGPMPATQAVNQAQAAGTQAGQGGFPRENTLRDEFTKLTGDFRTVQDAKNKIDEAGKIPTPAGDLTLLYAFNKLLDPNSVVRESEFATAAATGSLGERMQAAVGKLATGERLTDDQRKDFLDQANNIYKAQKRGYDNSVAQYTELANRYGLKPENVVTKFETGAPQGAGSSGGIPEIPGVPRIADDAGGRAAWEKLPPGSMYYGPDNKPYFKPGGPQ